MRVNQTIKTARMRLGLRDSDVAARAGLSIHEYCDVESSEQEALRVVHLGKMKELCKVLQLDLLDLFGIQRTDRQGNEQLPAAPPPPRNELIRARRAELGLSQAQLGDLIGFETGAIAEMEDDPDYLDGWSIELVVELASHLRVPPQVLLGVKCRTYEG